MLRYFSGGAFIFPRFHFFGGREFRLGFFGSFD